MADRYWVGGAGNWNSTTKWSTTSGGASGASVPTSADNAIFDAASGAAPFTATVTTGATCANLTLTPNATVGVTILDVQGTFVIAGTFSTSGTAGNKRHWIRSSTYGIMLDVQIATIGTVTDVDFRDIRITGTGGTLTGTRIGNLRGCLNITFDTAKTVYWNLVGAQNWSATGWAPTSGGTPADSSFPLAQDTAVFDNTGSVTGTITLNTAIPYTGTVDMSGRTSAMTLSVGAFTIYGDWKNGSGTTLAGTGTLTYSGRNTQTITSAGKTFGSAATIDSYGGSVELADALNIGSNALTVTNGTFDTKNFNVTASALLSTGSTVRAITLGSSTLTLSASTPVQFGAATNLTFSAGTSQINMSATSAITFASVGFTFYNVSFTGTTAATHVVTGANTFNNFTLTATAATGLMGFTFSANQTITGTLTVAGATAVRRIFVRSDTLGTTRTLTVGTLSATDCDFRDITIAGTAAGSSPTRAGDCGGNSGITFPAGKTVYWNLAGAQNWSATGWATSSGGTPAVNNFPLAQDTATFDNTGSVTGTITINQPWNIGTFDASARTSAMTLTTSSNNPFVHGDWKFGTGVTSSSTAGTITFAGRSTQTITSNGVTFGCPIEVRTTNATAQLADAVLLNSARSLTITSGTFDAVSYNVTTGSVVFTAGTLKMGSGTWTLSGTGGVWAYTSGTFYKGTANIVLSDTSTSARTFDGNGLSYNKLTIGGTTGTSTLTIAGNNQFTELASTKTVAHTIALGATTQTFGKWMVTGTAGNVVTVTGTATLTIAGACTSGLDYLALGTTTVSATSPGEFYAGVNSTATSAAAPLYLTAKPADSTRYWVGGTGNWSATTSWSTTSGGASGAAVPRSHDDVVFDSASNATAYTATINAVTGGVRMKKLTVAGPASGNVTLAGSALTFIHDNVALPATGLTLTYSGTITFTGSASGKTLTTNGVSLGSNSISVNGVDCAWSLGSAATLGLVIITNGSIDFAGYAVTALSIATNNANSCTLNFGSGTTTLSATTPINFGGTETNRANLTVTASTSQINCSATSPTFSGNNKTFYNVSFTSTSAGTVTLDGVNSYNNLSFTGITAAGLKIISVTADQTVTGTLTFSAGTDATMRHFCRSFTLGTARTITAAAVSMTDVDFRDITLAGAAAPASGTRIGDCKGNSGITFTAAANKYWSFGPSRSWSFTGWALTAGGTPAANNFPLAQDICIFDSTNPNAAATITIDQSYNIGTIDMSARTTNTMTLATGSTLPTIHGNWVNGTGTTLSGTQVLFFGGRGSQTVTSAGKTFTQQVSIFGSGTTVTLLDAFTISNASGGLTLNSGTFDAATYNVTLLSSANVQAASGTDARTLAVGSGTWTISTSGTAWNVGGTGFSVTGTGTISLTSASAKTFAGGSVSYSGITLNQGGAGTLSISGNNTFKTISNTSGVANTINIGTTTQTLTTSWTAAGTAGNVQTVSGTSASSPGTLVFTGGGIAANVDYLAITGIRAYSLDTTWYAGTNSTNNGSLGWYFTSSGGTTYSVSFADTATAADAVSAVLVLSAAFSDTATAADSLSTLATFNVDFTDTATAADTLTTTATLNVDFTDTVTGADLFTTGSTFSADFSDTASASDSIVSSFVFSAAFSDTATAADALSAVATLTAAFSDTATAADTLAGTVTLNAAFSDTATAAESLTTVATLNVAFSDTATAADALTTIATLNVAFTDTATALDSISGALTLSASFSDTATAADTLAAALLVSVAVSETATGLDTPRFAGLTFNVFLNETAAGSDVPAVAASVFNVSLSETATGADTPTAAGTFNVSLNESGALTDLVAGGYLWNPIDDTQTANWQNVVTAPPTGWVDITNTQAPGWVEIQT